MAKGKSSSRGFFVFLFLLMAGVAIAGVLSLLGKTNEQIDESLYFPKDQKDKERLQYADLVESASKEFGVEEAIIYAVIWCESNFKANAESSAGAKGLMQMMPATFAELQGDLKETHGEDALFEPAVSIRYGTYYLSRMYARFGDWTIAFAAYNAGPTAVSKWLKDERYSKDGKLIQIPYSETENYVKKVTGMVEKYKEYYPMEVQNDT